MVPNPPPVHHFGTLFTLISRRTFWTYAHSRDDISTRHPQTFHSFYVQMDAAGSIQGRAAIPGGVQLYEENVYM